MSTRAAAARIQYDIRRMRDQQAGFGRDGRLPVAMEASIGPVAGRDIHLQGVFHAHTHIRGMGYMSEIPYKAAGEKAMRQAGIQGEAQLRQMLAQGVDHGSGLGDMAETVSGDGNE